MSSEPDNNHHTSEGAEVSNQRHAQSRFATTSWTVVLQAAAEDSQAKSEALATLCEAYWYPLYVFVRRLGNSAGEAEELTQSFFAELLDKSKLAKTDPSRGRFRTFLLTSLQNFLRNQNRQQRAIKRGGQQTILSIDYAAAESQYSIEPSHEQTPQKAFDRDWALALLNQVLNSLAQQYADAGKSELFEALKSHLVGTGGTPYSTLAQRLDMKAGAIKVAMHRLRERYGQMLRLQIAKTIEKPSDVDEELRYLFQVLSE